MRRIKSKHTKLEKKFFDALVSEGIGLLEWNPSDIQGNPDFADRNCKIAVFLDSCFWHGCSKHFRQPKSNVNYWLTKIERNKKRDRYVIKALKKEGWTVIRIWEHSLAKETALKKWAQEVLNVVSEKNGQ